MKFILLILITINLYAIENKCQLAMLRNLSDEALWTKYYTFGRSPFVRDELVRRYFPLVGPLTRFYFKRYKRFLDEDELVSSVSMGLISAVESFHPKLMKEGSLEDKFTSWFWSKAKGEVSALVRRTLNRRQPHSKPGHRVRVYNLPEDYEPYVRRVNRPDFKDLFIDLIFTHAELTGKEEFVLRQYYMQNKTLEEIALMLGAQTKANASHIKIQAIEKIRAAFSTDPEAAITSDDLLDIYRDLFEGKVDFEAFMKVLFRSKDV